MASSLRSFAAALLFVMLFMATEVGRNTIMVAEARNCKTPSAKYERPCFTSASCSRVCRKYEELIDGTCEGGASRHVH
ncbi:PREDICTED: defensin SD2-like [Ipomoea nil]|uniref:defensin SD2-like n=1 Tax=Ipomoea nil TaxID=35883 RepID=UPI000901EBFC|nr:PREDICTED: defensin SD2-like [Ipomoea nil]